MVNNVVSSDMNPDRETETHPLGKKTFHKPKYTFYYSMSNYLSTNGTLT